MSNLRHCTVCGRSIKVRYEGNSTIPRLPEGWTADTVSGFRCPNHRPDYLPAPEDPQQGR